MEYLTNLWLDFINNNIFLFFSIFLLLNLGLAFICSSKFSSFLLAFFLAFYPMLLFMFLLPAFLVLGLFLFLTWFLFNSIKKLKVRENEK